MDRCAGERGKGFFWSVDPNFEHIFTQPDSGAGKTTTAGSGKKKGASLLEPPLKRRVRGDTSGSALPPPLTTVPLAMKGATSTAATAPPTSNSSPNVSTPTQTVQLSQSTSVVPHAIPLHEPAPTHTVYPQTWLLPPMKDTTACSPNPTQPTSQTSTASLPTLPRIPFVVAPLPSSFKSTTPTSTSSTQLNPHELLVLHEGKLYLHPTIFANLTPEHLSALEALGMQKAIEVLKG